MIGVSAASGTGTGRAWAVEAFQAWARDAEASPIFFIAGPHGMGKSALAERCASLLGQRVLRYTLEAEDADTLEPRTFVETLARQIADILPVLFTRALDLHQKTFAMGEAVAHLHALWYQGRLRRSLDHDGVYRFAAVV